MVPCLPGGGARHHSHQVGERFEPSPADRTKERPPQGGCFFWPVSGGRGASAPTGGVGVRPISAMLIAGQCTPISLLVLPKEKRAVHGPKRKNALERSVPLRDGGRREMVPADSRWLSDGRGGVPQRLDSGFPRRGCGGQRGARTHLTSFSFRAFRFATRCPGGRGGLYQRADVGIRPYGRTMAFRVPVGADALIGPLQKPHQPPASGSKKGSWSMRRPPRQGRHHPPRDSSPRNRRRA